MPRKTMTARPLLAWSYEAEALSLGLSPRLRGA